MVLGCVLSGLVFFRTDDSFASGGVLRKMKGRKSAPQEPIMTMMIIFVISIIALMIVTLLTTSTIMMAIIMLMI